MRYDRPHGWNTGKRFVDLGQTTEVWGMTTLWRLYKMIQCFSLGNDGGYQIRVRADKGETMHSADDVDFVTYMKKRPLILKSTKLQGLFGDGYRQ